MKTSNSSGQGFKCVVDTHIKTSLCSRHTLGWLPSSPWSFTRPYSSYSAHHRFGGIVHSLHALLQSNPHLPQTYAYDSRRVHHVIAFRLLWLVQRTSLWFIYTNQCPSLTFFKLELRGNLFYLFRCSVMRMSSDPAEAMFLAQNYKANNQKEANPIYEERKRGRTREREKKFKWSPQPSEWLLY